MTADDTDSLSSQSPLAYVVLSGGIGGATGDSVMHSLDTVKTRQQGAPHALKYRSMLRAYSTLYLEEGFFRGLYAGFTPALLGSFPATCMFFGTYETTKRIGAYYKAPDTFVHLLGGLMGDLVSSVWYVPSEVLKTRLQLQGRHNNPHFYSGYNYKGFSDALKTIYRKEGLGALFFGYKATLARDLPFSGLQFAFYEKFHQWAQDSVGSGKDMGVGLELLTGAAGGGLAGVITTPLDVVKTRLQTQITKPTSVGGPADTRVILSDSVLRSLATIWRTERFAGLFSGVWPRFVWTSTQSSIMLLLYQTALKAFDVYDPFSLEDHGRQKLQ